MTDKLAEVRRLQKEIVKALETGKDSAPILKELAELRAKIAMEAEREALQAITDQRKALRDKAEAVKVKVQQQGQAIDNLLVFRDDLVKQLQPLLDPMRELAKKGGASWERDPGECYLYNDATQFQGAVRDIPRELLPVGFTCATLEMTAPGERSFGKSSEAFRYFAACIGILQNFRKGSMTPTSQPTDDSLLLDGEPEAETNCLVCGHEAVEAINKGLKGGKPLRELETEFNVSRSTLCRHKNRCLNMGTIRITE